MSEQTFVQKDGYSVKKSEVLSVSPLNLQSKGNLLGNSFSSYINEKISKLSEEGIEINDPKELVIRGYKEYLAVQAIRKKKQVLKAQNTQKLLNKIKKLL